MIEKILRSISGKPIKSSKPLAGERGGSKVLAGIAYDPEIAIDTTPLDELANGMAYALEENTRPDTDVPFPISIAGSGNIGLEIVNRFSDRGIIFGHSFGINHICDLNVSDLNIGEINDVILFK